MTVSNLRRCSAALALGLITTSLSVPAGAVFPDKPTTDFKAVGMIGTAKAGVFNQSGCGVAISPNWVLSVSHVGGNTFVEEGVQYPISQKIIYQAKNGEPADLALFRLGKPVPIHTNPVPARHGALGTTPKGSMVFLVGYGRTAKLRSDGRGWQPVLGSEGQRRVATNIVDNVGSNRYNIGTAAAPKWKNSVCLEYDIDKRGDQKFSVLGTAITQDEGGVGAKDSGGGWFVTYYGRQLLVGISASVGKPEGSTIPNPYCYGGLGFGIYLDPYKGWIYEATGLDTFRQDP